LVESRTPSDDMIPDSLLAVNLTPFANARSQHHGYMAHRCNKCLDNAKRPYGCGVLCLPPKSSLCSCPHYGRIVLFTSEFYRLTERVVISMHVDATTG